VIWLAERVVSSSIVVLRRRQIEATYGMRHVNRYESGPNVSPISEMGDTSQIGNVSCRPGDKGDTFSDRCLAERVMQSGAGWPSAGSEVRMEGQERGIEIPEKFSYAIGEWSAVAGFSSSACASVRFPGGLNGE
jgi:hypothetical protein